MIDLLQLPRRGMLCNSAKLIPDYGSPSTGRLLQIYYLCKYTNAIGYKIKQSNKIEYGKCNNKFD